MGVVFIKEEGNIVLRQAQINGGKKPQKPKDVQAIWNNRDFSIDLRWKGQKDRLYLIYGTTEETCVIDEACFLGKTERNHFVDTDIRNGKRRNYQIMAVNKKGAVSEPASIFFDVRFDKPVRYAGMECTTKSDWSGIYGKNGYSFRGVNGFEQLPSYISEIRSNGNLKTENHEEECCPYLPDSNRRHRGYESNIGTLSYTMIAKDEEWHQAVFYCIKCRSNGVADIFDGCKLILELKILDGRRMEQDIFLENVRDVICIKVKFRSSFILNFKNMVHNDLMEMICAAIFFD